MKLKICFFGDGESIHIIRWCKHFASLNHEVHLISFKNVAINGIQTHFVNCGKINSNGGNWKVLFKYREVKKTVRTIKPDIFHAHYATSYGITGALCNYHPYIISTWGSDILVSVKRSIIYKLLLKFAFSKADMITVVANHMKTAIISLGIDTAKIHTVTHGIDPAIFNDFNKKMDTQKFMITSTRSFETVYNIPHIIHAFAQVKKTLPNAHLNLIGGGTLQKELESLIYKSELTDSVTFFGRITQPEIAKVLNYSHVFISVALSDGDPVSLIEALACNTFCITSNIIANQQWINEGVNGFLIEINDVEGLKNKIIEVYHDYEKLKNKATPFNKKNVEERAIWFNNMKMVEDKYVMLINKKFK